MTSDDAEPPGRGSTGDAAKPRQAPTGEQEFGWRGWVLVAALVASLIVVPWTLIALPGMQGFVSSLGLGLRDAYLVLPLLPALGLGALAVWSAVASRKQ